MGESLPTMKAILVPEFITDPSTLTPTTTPAPKPKPDEYLIRVTHCSPQHADILHAQGKHQNTHPKKGHVHPPFILGYDFAGVVEQTPSGDNSGELSKGERVFGASIGAFAEYVAIKPHMLRRIPDGLSSETACAASGQAVSFAAAAYVANVRAGDVVLVSGASGGLGSACCSAAKALGARVIALVGDKGKAEAMRRDMDVDEALVMEGEKWVDRVREITDGRGVDVVLDNTGMVTEATRCVAYGGTIVILGFAARKGEMEEVKMNRLLLKSITLIGYRFGEDGRRYPAKLEEIWDRYLRLLTHGQLKPFIYGQYNGLGDVGRALKDLAERKVYGRIVVSLGAADASAEKAKL